MAPHTPITIVRRPGFDCHGARTTKRVYQRSTGFVVQTTREFYNRRGDVDDYEVASETFHTLIAALHYAGATLPAAQVAA
jgi:hypothetical protein